MSRLTSKYVILATAAVVLLFYFFSSGSPGNQYALSVPEDDALIGAIHQQGALRQPPVQVVSDELSEGIKAYRAKKKKEAEEKKKKDDEEKKKKEEEAKKKEEEAKKKNVKTEDEVKKVQEVEKNKKVEERLKQDRTRIVLDTFEVPKDITYSEDGPKPDQVILLTASDGKGHNGGIENIMGDVVPNRQRYCDHHGYHYQFINISKFDIDGAHPVWAKLPALVEAFNTHPEAQWLWWLDLDAIIMTPNISLVDHLLKPSVLKSKVLKNKPIFRGGGRDTGLKTAEDPDVSQIDLIITQDQNGVNAGSFMLRRSEFTKMLLQMWVDPLYMNQPWPGREQDALGHMIMSSPFIRKHVGFVTQNELNAYPLDNVKDMGYFEGGLVVHLAGCWVMGKCNEQWTKYLGMAGKLPGDEKEKGEKKEEKKGEEKEEDKEEDKEEEKEDEPEKKE